jgi:hypothetical protein
LLPGDTSGVAVIVFLPLPSVMYALYNPVLALTLRLRHCNIVL